MPTSEAFTPAAGCNVSEDSMRSTSSSEESAPKLPVLQQQPAAHPGCCLALSKPLVDHLCSLLRASSPQHQGILSIGSGYGLLEALLRAPPYSLDLIGVEVAPSPNRYLPRIAHRVVHGSRFLEPLASTVSHWLFVYPRRPGLVSEYLSEHAMGALRQVVWVGPQADWDDYAQCFKDWHVHSYGADAVGGRAWELISVATKGNVLHGQEGNKENSN